MYIFICISIRFFNVYTNTDLYKIEIHIKRGVFTHTNSVIDICINTKISIYNLILKIRKICIFNRYLIWIKQFQNI